MQVIHCPGERRVKRRFFSADFFIASQINDCFLRSSWWRLLWRTESPLWRRATAVRKNGADNHHRGFGRGCRLRWRLPWRTKGRPTAARTAAATATANVGPGARRVAWVWSVGQGLAWWHGAVRLVPLALLRAVGAA